MATKGSLAQFRRDERAEKEGIWVGKQLFDPNPDGTYPEFLVRMADDSNPEYERACILWRRKNPRFYRARGDVAAQMTAMNRYVFPRACIKGWRNFLDDDGNQIPFVGAAVVKYFDEFDELYTKLFLFAQDTSHFLKEDLDELVKESVTTSSGTTPQVAM